MEINAIIREALAEDLGQGDHTSLSTIPKEARGKAQLVAKEKGILSGIEIARKVFYAVDPEVSFTPLKKDGDILEVGDIIFLVEGSSISLLSAERLALNFMQRMSGIATKTNYMVSLIAHTSSKLLDTRKTTPLVRELEKMAVKHGGGCNHRFGLYDMIMIKDNHIDFAGGISQAVNSCVKYLNEKKLDLKIEVEVRNFDELNQVLALEDVDRVMLDNFTPENMKKAVEMVHGKIETEASGGITEENIAAYAETGVDYISVGALTHHIKSLDMSLKAQ